MPTDYRLTKVATYQTTFENNANAVLQHVTNNPGQSATEIATNLDPQINPDPAINQTLVNQVLEVLKYAQLVVGATRQDGELGHWTAEEWVSQLKTNLGNARTWQANNNNGLVSAMATDLSIDYAIAERLGWILEAEGTSKRTDA